MKHGTFFLTLAIAFAALAARADEADPQENSGRVAVTNSQQAVSSSDVQKWIAELGSPNYRNREAAMQHLISAGPQATELVAKAAKTDDLEVAYRCVGVLQSILESGTPTAQQEADRALESLAAKKTTVVASLATDALALYLSNRQDRAIEQLRRLGADISNGLPGIDNGMLVVKINKDWHGHGADWDLFSQIPELQRLNVYGVALDDSAVKSISQLKQLTMLDLFGTGISVEATEKLGTALPGVKIERRNGALLGIGGHAGTAPCRVDEVQTHSAAEAADIRTEDEIVSFDGKPVNSFEEFTALVAGKNGGDRVKMEIRRNDQVITKQVTLGQWQ